MKLNKVIKGDALDIMKKMESNSIDLVYLDPPFFTQRVQTQTTRDNNIKYSFEDSWDNITHYLIYLEERLIECKRIIKKTGSIFLHCDKNASHHLRLLLDKVFGQNNFRNEIVWTYKKWSNSRKGLLNSHQNIFFYSKSSDFKFNKIFTDYSPTTNVDQILQARERNHHNKSVYKRSANGEIILGKEKEGVPLSDVWEIPFLNPKAAERVGYPTQKPILLLERIINLVTDENDIVFDPFCGSGTTLVAASLLNRNYLGIDISQEAVNLSRKRLENPIKTDSFLLKKGKDAYINKDAYIVNILSTIDATIVQRNNGIDGFLKKFFKDKPVAVYVQRKNQSLSEAATLLSNAGNKKGCLLKILIRTNDVKTLIAENNTLFKDNIAVIDSIGFQLLNKL